MGENELVLKPRLIGKRFDKHDIPFSVLRDLAQLEPILLKASKDAFLRANPDRSRVPKGFLRGFSLNIASVADGSAIPEIRVHFDTSNYISPEFTQNFRFIEAGIQKMLGFFDKAANSDEAVEDITQADAAMYAQLGKSLFEDESIEFTGNFGKPIAINTHSRLAFFRASAEEYLTENRTLVGVVIQCDSTKNVFSLRLISDEVVSGIPFTDDYYSDIMASLESAKSITNRRLSLECSVIVDRQNKIKEIESISKFSLLHVRDVPSRLEEFAYLEPGWLEGYGDSFDLALLKELGSLFVKYYPNDLDLPYTYPDEKDTICFEWEDDVHSVSLDFNLSDFSAVWYDMDKQHDTITDDSIPNFRQKESWDILINKLYEVFAS